MNQGATEPVRVRFAPSPTGYLHIGGARTALFNWLLARKMGGTFVLRIEDTDRTRHVEDSLERILGDLRWLGLTWDEGPEVGGACGPYFQSERLDIYQQHVRKLLESGDAYYALESTDQLNALREQARTAKLVYRYQRPDPLPTIEQGEAAKKAGQRVVVRFKMPGTSITVHDDILGDVTLATDQLEDFVIQKSDGFPTYHFACVVDDEMMKITHVLRGQEHLINTPRHVALQQALGFSTPHYAHMPVIFNMSGSKMSKRDKEKAIAKGETPPEIDVRDFRAAGYLPEAVLNFISLLGWSPGDDLERFDLTELIELFSLDRVGKGNAKFDRVKLLSFNGDWVERVSANRRLEAFKDYVSVSDSPMGRLDEDATRWVLEACAGMRTFADVEYKAGFLCKEDTEIQYQPKALKKVLAKNDGAGYTMLEFVLPRLESLEDFSAGGVEKCFEEICSARETKLGHVAQPVRVAITGTTISPSIFETLERLGKASTIARIKRCLSLRESAVQ